MQTFSQTTAGAQTLEFNIPGKYFTLLETALGANVAFYKQGKKLDLGEINGLLAGIEAMLGEPGDTEPAFDRVTITTLGADTITFGIGNGQVRYNRSQGSVEITNMAGMMSQYSAVVTNASTVVIGSKLTRRYLLIQNKDPVGNIYVNFVSAASVANGIHIPPGGSLEFNSFAPQNGMRAISDIASNPNVMILEF